ncbi:hypothetical protein ACHWQZ_G017534 [Mnemiopsis leidyi]
MRLRLRLRSLKAKLDQVCKRDCYGLAPASVILLHIAIIVVLVLVLGVYRPRPLIITVQTDNAGRVVGRTVLLKDGLTKVHEFHNIHYAHAPIGRLRFRPPVRSIVRNNETEVVATENKEVECVRSDSGVGDEDCLVLTVRSSSVNTTKPVLVWLHGGDIFQHYNGLQHGYSFTSEMTAELDAVTVNINYRLGFLGFSSVEELWDEEAGVYANNGIRDIIAALDWIQDNIAGFGGDPNSVTIIGESGGATAVLALACSPLANNKFHAAIAQSPAPEMRFTYREGNDFQRSILEQAGCNQETVEERKQCLLRLPANKFSAKHGVEVVNGSAHFEFPTTMGVDAEYIGLIMIDPTVVTVSPRDLGAADFHPSSPLQIIISSCAEETYRVITWPRFPPFSSKEDLRNTLYPQIRSMSYNTSVTDILLSQYSDQDPVKVWSLLTTDMRSTCPTNDVAEIMSGAANRTVYRLYVSHRSGSGLPPFHGYDTFAFFGYSGGRILLDPTVEDVDFRSHYIKMVKKFSHSQGLEDGWGAFPEKTMIYENSDTISNISSIKPQQRQCKILAELDLVKYGWQN